jgi:hypothetical protein
VKLTGIKKGHCPVRNIGRSSDRTGTEQASFISLTFRHEMLWSMGVVASLQKTRSVEAVPGADSYALKCMFHVGEPPLWSCSCSGPDVDRRASGQADRDDESRQEEHTLHHRAKD